MDGKSPLSFLPVLPDLRDFPVLPPRGPTRPPVQLELKLPRPRRRYAGLILSLVFHGFILAFVLLEGDRIWSQTFGRGDPRLGDTRAGGGGGRRVAYITLPPIPRPVSPPRVEVTLPVPPPTVVHTPAPEPVVPSPVSVAPTDTVAVADTVRGRTGSAAGEGGVAEGAGTGSTVGPGAGPGAGAGVGGEGGGVRPPEPRDMAFPFDTPPKELRGVSLSVTFWVQVDGRVERYEVEPPIKDQEYAKKFDQVMRAFRFTPARTPDGRRVAGITKISFTLPGKSNS